VIEPFVSFLRQVWRLATVGSKLANLRVDLAVGGDSSPRPPRAGFLGAPEHILFAVDISIKGQVGFHVNRGSLLFLYSFPQVERRRMITLILLSHCVAFLEAIFSRTNSAALGCSESFSYVLIPT